MLPGLPWGTRAGSAVWTGKCRPPRSLAAPSRPSPCAWAPPRCPIPPTSLCVSHAPPCCGQSPFLAVAFPYLPCADAPGARRCWPFLSKGHLVKLTVAERPELICSLPHVFPFVCKAAGLKTTSKQERDGPNRGQAGGSTTPSGPWGAATRWLCDDATKRSQCAVRQSPGRGPSSPSG